MKTHGVIGLASIVAMGVLSVQAEITTGWMQTEKNGTSEKNTVNAGDFFAAENWVGGVVNGVFSADLPALFQWSSLSGDYTGAFDFSYTGDYTTLTFGSNTTVPRTVYLNGDFNFRPALALGKGKVTFGNSDVRKSVNFDLGGVTRNFYVEYNLLNFYSAITNGNVNLIGKGGTMNINGPAYIEGNVDVAPNMTLTMGFQAAIKNGRVGDVTLTRSNLSVFKPNENCTDTMGKIKVSSARGSASTIQLTPNGKTYTLESSELEMDKGALLAIKHDGTLGDALKVKFVKTPETVGGVIPGILVCAKANASINGVDKETYSPVLFAKYESEAGVFQMTDADFATDVSSETDVDLRVGVGQTLSVEGNASVNSLILDASGYRSDSSKITGEGTLSVRSGMVLGMGVKTGAKLDIPVNFGNRLGYLIAGGSEATTLEVTKPVYGTGGLVLTRLLNSTASEADTAIYSSRMGLVISVASDEGMYTGDTYIEGPVKVGASPFLPHGVRKGDVYLNGYLQGDDLVLNGLYGNGGYGRSTSNGKTLTLGDNDANGDFSGTIENPDVNGKLIKIGNGTQRFAGILALGSEINVNAGRVVLDGTVTSGAVKVAAGAALGGTGTVETSVAFADGAKLSAQVKDGALQGPLVVAALTYSEGQITVEASTNGWKTAQSVLKVTEGTIDLAKFKRGAHVGALTLSEDGTELVAAPKKVGFAVVIR